MPAPLAVVAWSSGKDAAFALEEVRRNGTLQVVGLLTTVTTPYARISMHGVRESLLSAQATSLGLPVTRVEIPAPCPNAVYEAAMRVALAELSESGVTHVVFGDLYLEDVRRYREERMATSGITPVFPLWGRPTDELARTMIASGLRATVVCVDPRKLPASFAGREFDDRFLSDLPPGVDPCGENGEFHTFVHSLPSFRRPIACSRGPVVEREGFVFADLDLSTDSSARSSGPSA
ncbi:MAG TPA: ATP-binding protein [Thermoplasmata archaeon]|nr:ATP-binding protein [Thermoplasmata archaeon]